MPPTKAKPAPTGPPGVMLLLIRHAHTDWVGQKLAGWTPGIPLNAEGRQQAWTLSGRLASIPLKAIYTSPIERAVETATIIAQPHGLPATPRDGLKETQYGDWTGQSLKVLARTNLWKQIQTTPADARFPNGESIAECQARIVADLHALRAQHAKGGGMIAIVSHGDPIKLAIASLLGMPLNDFQKLVINTASVTMFGFSPTGEAHMVRYNDTGNK